MKVARVSAQFPSFFMSRVFWKGLIINGLVEGGVFTRLGYLTNGDSAGGGESVVAVALTDLLACFILSPGFYKSFLPLQDLKNGYQWAHGYDAVHSRGASQIYRCLAGLILSQRRLGRYKGDVEG